MPQLRAEGPAARVERLDWAAAAASLDARGHARLGPLLTPEECAVLVTLYDERRRFRSFVDMDRLRYGSGDYRYFAAPLPRLVATLRTALYARLAPVANRWMESLRSDVRYPPALRAFLARCHAEGQRRPTPLLLHYEEGGYNALHQDLYGAVAFPLQVAILLSRPGADFEGGEILLVEQRPRAQSVGEAIALTQGEALVFANRHRPLTGSRGAYRANVRHGVSRVTRGRRLTLGLIFHDAR